MGNDVLLTPAEAAERCGVTVQTITRWAREGKIRASFTAGGHRRYTEAECQRVTSGPPLPEDVPARTRMDEDLPEAARRL